MLKRLIVLLAFLLGGLMFASNRTPPVEAQDVLAAFKNNNCVNCHSRLTTPYRLTSHYADWHISTHKDKSVSCEQCHGGDASISDAKKAHEGVHAASQPTSKLHPKHLATTCNACHKEIANSFVESKHYQNLTSAGLGPSCSTCHQHMASEVIYTPDQTAKLCAGCHDSTNALMPKRPEIPGQAETTMQALRRANMVTLWVERLVEEAKKKKVDIGEAEKEAKIVRAMLAESKIAWHSFNLTVVQKKADAAFEAGTQLKDNLRAKLYPNSNQ
jgi:predicted CXXCH cytochrome family protein